MNLFAPQLVPPQPQPCKVISGKSVPSACVGGWPLVHPSVPLHLLDAWPVRRWRCDQSLRVTSGWLGSLRRSPCLHPGQSSEHGPLGQNPPKQSWGVRKEVVHEERSSWRSGSIAWRRWPEVCFLWPSQKLLCPGQTHRRRPGSPNKDRYLLLLDPVLGPATVCKNASNSHHPCGRHSVVISCWDDWRGKGVEDTGGTGSCRWENSSVINHPDPWSLHTCLFECLWNRCPTLLSRKTPSWKDPQFFCIVHSFIHTCKSHGDEHAPVLFHASLCWTLVSKITQVQNAVGFITKRNPFGVSLRKACPPGYLVGLKVENPHTSTSLSKQ